MLIISRQQLAALDAVRLDRFRRLLRTHLGDVIPDSVAGRPESEVQVALDAAVAQAQDHGLRTERDVARFVTLVFALGRDFPDQPATAWAGVVLRDPNLEATDRVDRLFSGFEPSYPALAALWKAWRG